MNKKIIKTVILILIIMIEVLSIPKVDYGAGTNLKIGDVNGDGIIDSRDTLKILEHIAASNIPKIKQKHSDWILKDDKLKTADINEDGIVDSRDTLRILEYIASSTIPKIAQKHPTWKTYIENKWKIEATGISLNNTNIKIEKGKVIQLKATVTPENASNKVVTWNSLDTKVATVDGIGNVTGKSEGIAVITARTSNGLTRTCQVKVIEPTLAEKATKIITSAPLYRNVEKGKYVQLTAKVSPDNATYKTITWSSSNTKVVTVSSTGKVYVKGHGKATITALQKESGLKATYTIVGYTPAKSISINKTTTKINKGNTEKLKVTFNPESTSSKTLTWKSSNTSVATVDNKGVVKAISKGTAIITATSTYGKNATCKVEVVENQRLLDSLRYAYKFTTQAGGHITYADHDDPRRDDKLEKGYSDCSHFVHRVFEHTGVMKKFVRSEQWGYHGCPNTIDVAHFKKGEKWDYSNASPGDVIWEHYGSGTSNHVYIYIGNGKKISCSAGHDAGKAVNVGEVHKVNSSTKKYERKIIHFKEFPIAPNSYFDLKTQTIKYK